MGWGFFFLGFVFFNLWRPITASSNRVRLIASSLIWWWWSRKQDTILYNNYLPLCVLLITTWRMIIKSCMSEEKKQSAGQFAMLSAVVCFGSSWISPEKVKGIKAPLIPSGEQVQSSGGRSPILRERGTHFRGPVDSFCLSCVMMTAFPAFCFIFVSWESS